MDRRADDTSLNSDKQLTALERVIEYFRPSVRQLALRLRELASAGEAKSSDQLLCNWGGEDADDGASASLAVVSRDPGHFPSPPLASPALPNPPPHPTYCIFC